MTTMSRLLLVGVLSHALSYLPAAHALDNGLARTPPMGWNSWNHFGCSINEDIILGAAHAIKNNGLDELGYNCTCFARLLCSVSC